MKSPFLLLLVGCIGLAVAPLRAENRFAGLRGSYSGSCTVETSSEAAGSAKVVVETLRKHSKRALFTITGSLTSNGNVVPLLGRLRWDGRRVHASSFLLGLQGVSIPTQAAHLRGGGGKYRFVLLAASGAELNGELVSGRVNVTLELADKTLKIHGGGTLRTAAGRNPVSIVIEATKS